MAVLPVRSRDTIVATFAAAAQGRINKFLNFAVGSILLAVAEAQAGVALWLQAMLGQVLKVTRAATSEGDDLDTWMGDWFLARLPASAAVGFVTLGRYTFTTLGTVPVGSLVQTGDGSQRFTVVADPANAAYDGTQDAYLLPAGIDALTIPVAAVTPGTAGNVAAGAINLIASSIPGIDLVVNAAPLSGGLDAEADADYRTRFQLYIAGLAKGTDAAIRSAIANIQQGLQVGLQKVPGFVTVTVDDGSGTCAPSILTAARTAVDAVRAAGVIVTVQPAQRLDATVQMTVAVAPGYAAPDVVARVTAALGAAINATGLGQPLRFAHVITAASAVLGVRDVTGVLLNNAETSLIPLPNQSIKAGALIVSPTV